MNTLWPGCVEIFAGMGTQWYPVADKPHRKRDRRKCLAAKPATVDEFGSL